MSHLEYHLRRVNKSNATVPNHFRFCRSSIKINRLIRFQARRNVPLENGFRNEGRIFQTIGILVAAISEFLQLSFVASEIKQKIAKVSSESQANHEKILFGRLCS